MPGTSQNIQSMNIKIENEMEYSGNLKYRREQKRKLLMTRIMTTMAIAFVLLTVVGIAGHYFHFLLKKKDSMAIGIRGATQKENNFKAVEEIKNRENRLSSAACDTESVPEIPATPAVLMTPVNSEVYVEMPSEDISDFMKDVDDILEYDEELKDLVDLGLYRHIQSRFFYFTVEYLDISFEYRLEIYEELLERAERNNLILTAGNGLPERDGKTLDEILEEGGEEMSRPLSLTANNKKNNNKENKKRSLTIDEDKNTIREFAIDSAPNGEIPADESPNS